MTERNSKGGEKNRTITGSKNVIKQHHNMWQAIFTERLSKEERKKAEEKKRKYQINEEEPEITLVDFMEEIKGGKPKTSPGPDMITNDIWKALPTKIQARLGKILLLCWKTRKIPNSWRKSNIILIPKSDETEYIVNYRPIALCQCSYKFFSRVLLKKMKQHAEKKRIISQSQFGVRKNATIHKAVLTYIRVINDAIAKNKDLYTLSLDMTKAYDSVLPKVLKEIRLPSGDHRPNRRNIQR
jgi:hypothetical protein